MCRHLATLGNVTYKEADTPRGRALILDKVRMNPEHLKNSDYVETLYQSTLSAACRTHCVTHYDEAGLQLAARRDIMEADLAPAKVATLAEKLKQAEFTLKGAGSVLYYQDPNSENAAAYQDCKVISGGDTGKALEVLGYAADSVAVLAKFQAAVATSSCKTLVTSCPASFDFLKDKLSGVKVLHSSEYLLANATAVKTGKVTYLDSDFLKNYNDNLAAPRELLEKCGYELVPFGTNTEESYAVGEGAVVYDALYPQLAQKLCRYLVELADDLSTDVFVVASPYAKRVLNQYAPEMTVLSLEEAVMGGVA
jgi:Fe-S oxidoreductase